MHPKITAGKCEAIDGRQTRREIIAWVGSNIVPHEPALRARLRRQSVPEEEIDDVVQEAYLALSRLDSIGHIHNARAYFFTTARNALYQRLRHQRVVRIDSLMEADTFLLADDDPGPERQVSGRMELERVRRLIAQLPDRCRTIFTMRRIQGIPQREIAAHLGVSEKVVEAQAIRGLKLILHAIRVADASDPSAGTHDKDEPDHDRYSR